ncbi:MAG: AAA family ATPase [Alphaproteobacteria bacterium]|nr:AAA family ATPase [Alphaproteobacteria bacterium]
MQTFETAYQKKKIDRFEMMELAQIWVNFYQKGLCLPSVRQMSFNGQKKHFIEPVGEKMPKKRILQQLSRFLSELTELTDKRCASIFLNHLLALMGNPLLCHYLPRQTENPVLISIGGLSGSGKSRVARECAPLFNALIVRDDIIRKNLAGVPFSDELNASFYTPEWEKAVYREMRRYVRIYLKNGFTVIAEGLFYSEEERLLIQKEARKFPFCGLWLEAPLGARAGRVKKRKQNPSDVKTKEALIEQLTVHIGNISWNHLLTAQDKNVTVSDALEIINRVI